MTRTRQMVLVALWMAGVTTGASAQVVEPDAARCTGAMPGYVVVYGDGVATVRVPHAELAALPRVAFRGQFHDGRPAHFEGVRVWDLVRRAGVPDTLRGGDLLGSVIVEAADGYRVRFSLAELSPAFRAEVPLLADRQEGLPIRAGFGPVQVIVPGDLRQSRWVRQVGCLRIES